MAPDCEPARSQHSTSVSDGGGSGSSDRDGDDAMADAPSRLTTPDRETECTLVELFESYEIVDAYLKEKRAPERVQAELDAMVKLVRRVVMTPPTPSCTEEAIKTLQNTVQKLADSIKASGKNLGAPQALYVAVAGVGASKRPIILLTP
jgi:hypothetical protein